MYLKVNILPKTNPHSHFSLQSDITEDNCTSNSICWAGEGKASRPWSRGLPWGAPALGGPFVQPGTPRRDRPGPTCPTGPGPRHRLARAGSRQCRSTHEAQLWVKQSKSRGARGAAQCVLGPCSGCRATQQAAAELPKDNRRTRSGSHTLTVPESLLSLPAGSTLKHEVHCGGRSAAWVCGRQAAVHTQVFPGQRRAPPHPCWGPAPSQDCGAAAASLCHSPGGQRGVTGLSLLSSPQTAPLQVFIVSSTHHRL